MPGFYSQELQVLDAFHRTLSSLGWTDLLLPLPNLISSFTFPLHLSLQLLAFSTRRLTFALTVSQ